MSYAERGTREAFTYVGWDERGHSMHCVAFHVVFWESVTVVLT
jgi:hypothetical protein